MSETQTNNGGELPPHRQAIADANAKAFSVEYQVVADQRDRLQTENQTLKADLAIQKELYDIVTSRVAELESRVSSLTTMRDDAVRMLAERDTVLEAILGLLHTFQVKHTPVVEDKNVL